VEYKSLIWYVLLLDVPLPPCRHGDTSCRAGFCVGDADSVCETSSVLPTLCSGSSCDQGTHFWIMVVSS